MALEANNHTETITTTPGHPFYLEGSPTKERLAHNNKTLEQTGHAGINQYSNNWIAAGDLKVGDKIRQADGGSGTVVMVHTAQETRTMYNLDVASPAGDNVTDNFYVGTRGWLVHNCKTIALGLDQATSLDDFAKAVGGTTFKEWAAHDPANWRYILTELMANPKNKTVFNLDGVDVWQGVQRAARGGQGPTDFELYLIKSNPQWWDRITFYLNGKVVANPFK